MCVAIEAAELMDQSQWSSPEECPAPVAADANGRDVADELAKELIYLLGLAPHCEIGTAQAVVDKIVRHEVRFPVDH